MADVLQTVLAVDGLGAFSATFARASSILDQFGDRVDDVGRRSLVMAAGTAAGAGLIAAGLGRAVQAAGRLEQIRIGFTTLEGSAEAAGQTIKDLQDFADQTSFGFDGAARAAQQLRGAGTAAGETIPIMKALANIMAANGRSGDEFGRSLVQISQIISSGKLQGDELRVLAENGLPRAELMKEIGDTAGATADQFIAALVKIGMGAKYAGAAEAQSRSLEGRWNKLQDAGSRLAAAIGTPLLGPITGLVNGVADMVNAFNGAPEPLKALAGVVGVGLVGALGALSLAMVRSALTAGLLAGANAKAAASYYALGRAAGTSTAPVNNAAAATLLAAGTGGGFANNAAFRTLMAAGGKPVPVPMGARIGGFIRGGGGAGLLAAGAGMGVMSLSGENQTGSNIGSMLTGAGVGASVGSMAGPWGMLAGAIVGAIGSGVGILMSRGGPGVTGGPPADKAKDEQIALLKQQLDELRGIRSGGALSGKDMPGAWQVMSAMGMEMV